MSSKPSISSESASKRRSKAAASPAAAVQAKAPVAAPSVVATSPAPVAAPSVVATTPAPVAAPSVVAETPAPAAAPSSEGKGKRKAPSSAPKESKEPSSGRVKKPAAKSDETAEPPAKKPRKAATPNAEGESKRSKKKKASDASPSDVPAGAGTGAPVSSSELAKEDEECVEDGNPCIGRYLRALLKRQFVDSTISKDAIHQVQKYVYQFGLHFLVAVKRHLESAKKNTLMMHDMPTCLQRSLSRSSLYQDFSNAMSAALTLYYASYQTAEAPASAAVDEAGGSIEEKRKQMWAARAGLSIPPTRTKEFAKKYLNKFRFSQNSITGLTALFEVLAQRIFKLSYDKAQEVSRKRISQLDVQSALKADSELSWLLVEPVVPIV